MQRTLLARERILALELAPVGQLTLGIQLVLAVRVRQVELALERVLAAQEPLLPLLQRGLGGQLGLQVLLRGSQRLRLQTGLGPELRLGLLGVGLDAVRLRELRGHAVSRVLLLLPALILREDGRLVVELAALHYLLLDAVGRVLLLLPGVLGVLELDRDLIVRPAELVVQRGHVLAVGIVILMHLPLLLELRLLVLVVVLDGLQLALELDHRELLGLARLPVLELVLGILHLELSQLVGQDQRGIARLPLRLAGLDLSGLVTTSAVITGVVAFSMQETLGNILGGLALQVDNSVRIGDWIKIDDVRGKVVEVHWRHTAVQTNNGSLIVIPNSVLMKSKVDVYSRESKPEFRRWVNFWIEDAVPPQQVIATVQTALRQAHIEHISTARPPECIVTDYREGLIQYAVRYWLTNPGHDDTTDSAVRIHFYSALQRQSMSLAHPCMDIRLNADSERRSSARLSAEMEVRKKALGKVALFSSLTEEELAKLAQALRNTPFVKGDTITRQGAVAHWLYLLVGGEADVWFEAEGQERLHCATLKAGDVFGEIGLLTGAPRGATVTARTDALCYRLDKENFASILHERPELADEFAHVLSDRNQVLSAIRSDHAEPEQVQQANYVASIRRFFRLS